MAALPVISLDALNAPLPLRRPVSGTGSGTASSALQGRAARIIARFPVRSEGEKQECGEENSISGLEDPRPICSHRGAAAANNCHRTCKEERKETAPVRQHRNSPTRRHWRRAREPAGRASQLGQKRSKKKKRPSPTAIPVAVLVKPPPPLPPPRFLSIRYLRARGNRRRKGGASPWQRAEKRPSAKTTKRGRECHHFLKKADRRKEPSEPYKYIRVEMEDRSADDWRLSVELQPGTCRLDLTGLHLHSPTSPARGG